MYFDNISKCILSRNFTWIGVNVERGKSVVAVLCNINVQNRSLYAS